MTPKEKATALVDKYYEDDLMWEDLSYIQAKKCALIAVDEIISATDFVCMDEKIWNTNLKYWNEVKLEIEKL